VCLCQLSNKNKPTNNQPSVLPTETQREPCILQATTIENVTSENVHDVVTDNFLCTGGTVPFVDHIACPGRFITARGKIRGALSPSQTTEQILRCNSRYSLLFMSYLTAGL